MARAETASASARADSIKGLAQSIANPAYRRLLTAEPALRRAVPALIIAFLLTIGVGAVVQVLDHHRQAIAEATHDIDNVADFVAERFDRLAGAENGDTTRRDLLERALSTRATAFKSWRVLESGRRARAKAALQRIADTPKLSRDVHDIAQRALADS